MPGLRDPPVRKTHLLGFEQGFRVVYVLPELPLHPDDLLKRLQEQLRDHRDLMQLLDGNAPAQQLHNCENVVVPEDADILHELLIRAAVKLRVVQMIDPCLQAADALEEAFFQIRADSHDLSGGFHLGPEGVRRIRELVEGEARELCHDVVERRLHGGGAARNGDLLQGHAHGNLGRHPRDGIAAGLGRQGGGTRDSGVDFDEVVFRGLRMQGKLHVAPALDLQLADDLQGAVVEHLQVMLVQAQDGRHDDGVARMHPHRVHVLHPADGDCMVVGVAHDLKLDLFISLYALLDENLMNGGEPEGIGADLDKLFFIVRKAAAGSAEGKGRSQHHGIADVLRRRLGFIQVVGDFGGNDRLADALAHLFEELAVLGPLDGGGAGAEQFCAAFPKDPFPLQLHREI